LWTLLLRMRATLDANEKERFPAGQRKREAGTFLSLAHLSTVRR
jgi:hypothetical protein